MLSLFKAGNDKFKDRYSFQVGFDPKKPWTSGYVVIDESDHIMFSDLTNFMKATKHKNLKVICLTATAFDGNEEGNERKALDLLGYKIYHYSKNETDFEPVVHMTVELLTKEQYADFIHKTAKDQPVLIYASGAQAEMMRTIYGVREVAVDTDHKELA